jgi:hypothetical protein
VWSPNVGNDFQPYGTNGYWVATEYGNTWVSDYNWGWATFHYGRWIFDNYYGWLWVPGNEWAPAWVAWRSGGGYYGWAPLTPNVNISVAFNHSIPSNYWVFVPQRYLCGPGVYNHHIRHNRVNIINHTTIVNNIHHTHRYYTGPSVREIERAGGRSVRIYSVSHSYSPGRTVIHNKSVNIYRPQIEQGQRNSVRPQYIVRHEDRNNNHKEHYRYSHRNEQYKNDNARKQNLEPNRKDQYDKRNRNNYKSDNQMKDQNKNILPVQSQRENKNQERTTGIRQDVQSKNSQQIAQRKDNNNLVRPNHERKQRPQTQRLEAPDSRKLTAQSQQRTVNSNQNQQVKERKATNIQTRSRSSQERKR